MSGLEITQASKIPYLNALWREDAEVWMESLTLGNTSQWIESVYGEDAAKSFDIGSADFERKEFRTELNSEYPIVFRRIQGYESIAIRSRRARRSGSNLGGRIPKG